MYNGIHGNNRSRANAVVGTDVSVREDTGSIPRVGQREQ